MNKVILIGNVGKEPAVRYLDGGVCVASVSLATTERGYTLQNGTQVPDRTEWHDVIFWRGLAETIEKYVHKGDKLLVEGKIQSRTYIDKQGAQRRVVEIMAENMEMLTPRSSGAQPAAQPAVAQAAAAQHSAQPAAQAPVQPAAQPRETNDELPF